MNWHHVHMKKFLFILIVILSAKLFTSSVLAAKPSVFPTRRPTMRVTNTRPVSPSQNQGTSKRAESISALLSRITQLFRQRLGKYQEFLTKVKSRVAKLQAEGKNVDKFDSYITTAQVNIQTVEQKLQHMEQTFAVIDKTADMKTIRQAVRLEMTDVRTAFTNLHTTMKQVVAAIREEQAKDTDVTTTPKQKPTHIPKPTGGNDEE